MLRRTKAMETSEGWRPCAGGFLALTGLLGLLGGCDASGAVGAYLGEHERQEIIAEPQTSTSATKAPPSVVGSAALVTTAAPPASVLSPGQIAVGAPMRAARPFESLAPVGRAPSGLAPMEGVLPTVPYPSHQGLSTPLNPIPGGVALGQPLPVRAPVVQNAGAGARHVAIGGAAVSGANVSNAARVVASLRAPLRGCYAREASPASGSMRFALTLGPAGAPSVTVTKSVELSSRLLTCAATAAKDLRFGPLDGGSATIQFPVTFVSDLPAKAGTVASPTPPPVPRGTTTL